MFSLRFSKYEGAGNDFIVIDKEFPLDPEQIRTLCSRRLGVGGDGLVLLQPPEKADARIRIYNCDGTEASFCGNALRCVALHLNRLGFPSRSYGIETRSGVVSCILEREGVRTKLPPPKILHWDVSLEREGLRERVCVVDTGVPHAVICLDDPEHFPLADLGKAVRLHPCWGEEGVNVNVVGGVSSQEETVRIRTYERGVEGETPACGSGAAAAAFVVATKRGSFAPLRMMPNSGQTLLCSFDEGPEGSLSVTGPARFVFQGIVDVKEKS